MKRKMSGGGRGRGEVRKREGTKKGNEIGKVRRGDRKG